ncbi:hypothetical protein [Adlercreutzia sp. ZJ242]|uniref:hypothetical protein n=1 Tax=Adlercreutzia sp. ZJ242 TaxID=2709409 RepID=UPI00197CEED1|nr:hypothetical protein [Adlercreutzia sp. ZJ242]
MVSTASRCSPIKKRYQVKFRTEGNAYYETIPHILNEAAREIVSALQSHLAQYEQFGRPKYAVGSDRIIGLMEQGEASSQR